MPWGRCGRGGARIPRLHAHDVDPANGDADGFPDPDAAGSRRALLGAAAAGFALAASGLLLPDRLVEEAEAESHPHHPVRRVQHRADKRRQRKHHRLKQKRAQNGGPNQNGGSNQDNPPGLYYHSIAVFVHNNSRVSKVLKVQGWKEADGQWTRHNGPNHPEEWVILPANSFVDIYLPAHEATIVTDEGGSKVSFDFYNPPVLAPKVSGYGGGWNTSGHTGAFIKDFRLDVNEHNVIVNPSSGGNLWYHPVRGHGRLEAVPN